MTQVVWKYDIPGQNEFTLEMPTGHRILSVQSQRSQLRLWALVDPSAGVKPVRFCFVGTGVELPALESRGGWRHLHTQQNERQDLVVHLFERVHYLFPLTDGDDQ